MKINLVIIALLFSVGVMAQKEVMFGLTGNQFNFDTRNSSQRGYGMIFSWNKIYMDISSNFAQAEGEQLKFSSSSTFTLNKVQAMCLNFGYILKLKSVAVIPIIGWGNTGDIYQDPVGWMTYYTVDKSHFNVGIIGRLLVAKQFSIQGGYATFEGIKIGISYNLVKDYSK